MAMTYRSLTWPTLILALAIAGCGGAGGTMDLDRGEGNIPVGKVVDPEPAPARIVITTSTRRRIEAHTDATGQVYVPQLPQGPTSFTIYPLDESKQTVSFGLMAGANQIGVFHVHLVNKEVSIDPRSIQGNFRDQTIMVPGQKHELQFSSSQALSGSVSPSYWVSGGKAAIRDGVLVAIEPGQGVLTVAYGVSSRSFQFTIAAPTK